MLFYAQVLYVRHQHSNSTYVYTRDSTLLYLRLPFCTLLVIAFEGRWVDNHHLGNPSNQHCSLVLGASYPSAQGCSLTPQSIQKPELFSHGMCLYAIQAYKIFLTPKTGHKIPLFTAGWLPFSFLDVLDISLWKLLIVLTTEWLPWLHGLFCTVSLLFPPLFLIGCLLQLASSTK